MKERISICGAGLAGSLLAVYLVERGFNVRVFEKRKDPRKTDVHAGRSINLAISHRGIRALREANPGLDKDALSLAVPMYGRAIHGIDGKLSFQAYGESSQHINSIGRAELNALLITRAEDLGVRFLFDHTCADYDAGTKQWIFSDALHGPVKTESGEIVLGADGAFSVIRSFLSKELHAAPNVETLEYGYKELEIAGEYGKTITSQEALHIWPRERFMLIALPNKDGSYTATLFLPLKGEISFETLHTDDAVVSFFEQHFSDTKELFPDLIQQFAKHPTSKLFTVHSSDWHNTHTLLIGDAAHALVPFYGQGMNAGFEDCRVLAEIIDGKSMLQWEEVFSDFYKQRKDNADAISDLALQNFIEMRDHVADASFLVRKKIEKYLYQQLAEAFIPQYTMVSFTDVPYKEAREAGILHQLILDEIMSIPDIEDIWPTAALQKSAVSIAEKHIHKKA